MANRPIGITILAIFMGIIGTIVLIVGIVLLVGSAAIAASGASAEIARNISRIPGVPVPLHLLVPSELLVVAASIFSVIVGIIILLISWGFWTGINLSRWIAIVFFGLSALSSLFELLQGQIGSIVSLAINGLIVYYLFVPHVKRFFRATI